MAKVRTDPVSLNEWTLEMNIAHEIANMFDSPFGFFYPFRLRRIFDIMPFDFRRFLTRNSKIYKLTPTEEGSGGGWDTKIKIPKGFTSDSRAIFIQFKSGTHSDGNTVKNSIFNVNKSNPNPHAVFSFNDNNKPKVHKPATQHNDLRNLANHLSASGLSANSVMYGFPRITTLEQFEKLDGNLLLYTTFLTINEMDVEARELNVNLDDGLPHIFRTCYNDINKREISSEPFLLKSKDVSHEVISEIMTVKLSYYWNNLYDRIPLQYLKDEITISIAEYLQVNPINYVDKLFHKRSFDELEFYFEKLYQSRIKNEKEVFGSFNENSFKEEVRLNIFQKVNVFFKKMDASKIDINKMVPVKYSSIVGHEKNVEFLIKNELGTTCIIF